MTIITFWTTLLKIFGLYLLISCFALTQQFFASLLFLTADDDFEQTIWAISVVGITLGVYILFTWLFLFKTSWLITRLKLTEGFSEERIDIRISSNSIIKIAIIVAGGLILIESLPFLVKRVFEFFQQKTIFRQDPGAGWILFYLIKSVFGYSLLTSSKPLANFIARKSETEIDEPVSGNEPT